MKTISEYPGLIAEVLKRSDERKERMAARRQAVDGWLAWTFAAVTFGAALGVGIWVYRFLKS